MITATGVQDLVYTNDLPAGYGGGVDVKVWLLRLEGALAL